tara:strand:+ start:246 stop:851 length:606 start_codon:yes stop_codon:yes gene_type:complete
MLSEVNGKPLIRHVFDICNQTDYDTYVVTNNIEIAEQVPNFIMTGEADNGTERCALAIKDLDHNQFVNVQGDMPDVRPDMIEKVIWHLKHYPIATLFTDMPEEKQNDPHTVKMIRAADQALWFGRGMTGYGDWHLGIYAYKRNPLELYHSLEVTQEERVEKLEQLRWLKGSWQIGCLHTEFDGIEINTPEELEEWNSRANT